MSKNKPKAIVFFQYLPPWRIDVFNEMSKFYDLTIVYTNSEVEGFKYNRDDLLKRLNKDIKNIFLKKGFKIGKRPIKFGIFKLINTHKPSIIFSHEYSATSIILATYLKLRIFNYKLVITTSDNLSMAESIKGIKFFFRNYVLNVSKNIIVYSEDVKNFYATNFTNLRVEICPNIQNPRTLLSYKIYFKDIIENFNEKFNLSESKVILYTGRLDYVKGLDLLLMAFSKSENSNFKLVLVGDGIEKNNLQIKCKELNIQEKVLFVGFYSGKELYAWYDLASFYVLPSRFEPFGAVVNEALVFGCPVMASKYIGAKDFINDSNGLLFDPYVENEFVSALNYFYKLEEKFSDNLKTNLMINSFEQYVKIFNEIYDEKE